MRNVVLSDTTLFDCLQVTSEQITEISVSRGVDNSGILGNILEILLYSDVI
jgi:hypothetical protein